MMRWTRAEFVTLSFEYGPKDKFVIQAQGLDNRWYDVCFFRDLVDGTEV